MVTAVPDHSRPATFSGEAEQHRQARKPATAITSDLIMSTESRRRELVAFSFTLCLPMLVLRAPAKEDQKCGP
jgi:hypothetical protein